MPQRHFGAVPVFAIILKIVAVISFLVSTLSGILGIMDIRQKVVEYMASPGAKALKPNELMGAFREPVTMIISGIVLGIVIWAFAELINMMRETEFNTRVSAGIKEEVSGYSYPAPDAIAPPAAKTEE